MSVGRWAVVASGGTLLALAGCGLGLDVPAGSASLTAARKAAVEKEVRQFSALVSQDVTQAGPGAWQKHLADDPAFFMAVDGKLQFPNRQAAREGIEEFTRAVPHIELNWGDDLRVDPLTPEFAVVASSWHEVWTDKEGHQTTQNGFFTGLAERHNGQWQFRNAHWSAVAPASKAP
ncbi:MAG TPA: hypothetical protein VGR55_14605 [Candidatus Acidoferrum sp.]|nr:hypothetical protein [Candidatus Acidoferrum sp.]